MTFMMKKKDTLQRFIDPKWENTVTDNVLVFFFTDNVLRFQFSSVSYAQDCVEITFDIPFFLDLNQLFLLISWTVLCVCVYIYICICIKTLKPPFKNFVQKTLNLLR